MVHNHRAHFLHHRFRATAISQRAAAHPARNLHSAVSCLDFIHFALHMLGTECCRQHDHHHHHHNSQRPSQCHPTHKEQQRPADLLPGAKANALKWWSSQSKAGQTVRGHMQQSHQNSHTKTQHVHVSMPSRKHPQSRKCGACMPKRTHHA